MKISGVEFPSVKSADALTAKQSAGYLDEHIVGTGLRNRHLDQLSARLRTALAQGAHHLRHNRVPSSMSECYSSVALSGSKV